MNGSFGIKKGIASAAVMAIVAAAGCAPQGTAPPMPVDKIDAMTLIGLTLPLRAPEQKGAIGVQMQIFFYTSVNGEPEAATVTGNLEMIMYEGAISPEDIGSIKPFQTWTFTADQLSRRIIKNMGLWGYHLPLEWGDKSPEAKLVTVVARYIPAGRPPIYSSPATVVLQPG